MTDKLRAYNRAPVPFKGQKKNFLAELDTFLNLAIGGGWHDGSGYTIIDLFGGSGLLAHRAKRRYPNARVIYNDFDNYAKQIEDIPKAVNHWHALRSIADRQEARTGKPLYRGHDVFVKVEDPVTRQEILDYVKSLDESELNIKYLTLWLVWSVCDIQSKEELVNSISTNCYWQVPLKAPSVSNDYLIGLERVSMDYREILHSYYAQDKVIYLIDPPYVGTYADMYKQSFKAADHIELLLKIKPPYLLFNCDKGDLLRTLDTIVNNRLGNWQSYVDTRIMTKDQNSSTRSHRNEILVYKL
ncbi:DNA adenine methylase [Psittacicella hinzii]|uniref:D12 class N6 adenine-specific DNA methyltransferase n=1 Tax=Psittacicella hinzii TaxID=2028575 RepID=A0A3A1YEZ2_9GAMM|nr:DNA adenine methylase [Psittacicella hinzii]RIY36006.1 hypothetical protein CKF58_06365 [Psittacicella hinzii]